MTYQRSWWLNFSVCLLFIIGGLYGIDVVLAVLKLSLFATLPASITSRTDVISVQQHVAAMAVFQVFMGVLFIISGVGCLKMRKYQGRFLGSACGMQLFLCDFVSIYIFDHYDIGLFISMMFSMMLVCLLNMTCRNELILSREKMVVTA